MTNRTVGTNLSLPPRIREGIRFLAFTRGASMAQVVSELVTSEYARLDISLDQLPEQEQHDEQATSAATSTTH